MKTYIICHTYMKTYIFLNSNVLFQLCKIKKCKIFFLNESFNFTYFYLQKWFSFRKIKKTLYFGIKQFHFNERKYVIVCIQRVDEPCRKNAIFRRKR